MVLVNDVAGYRICCECREVLGPGGDVEAFLAVHTGPGGCDRCAESSPLWSRMRQRGRRRR